jgi:hypothetical protein
MSFLRILLHCTTLDHKINFDIRKSLNVTNVEDEIQRCEDNSKDCFEGIERARLAHCHFITDRREQAIWKEKNYDGKNKILSFKRTGFKFVMMMMTTTQIVFVTVT